MTPSQIIALIRDALLIAGVGFLVWFIWRDGKNTVKVADMQAVQKQIYANSQQQAAWAAQRQQAEETHGKDIAAVSALISAHNQPLIVRIPTSAGPVPSAPAQTAGICPTGGGGDSGDRVDFRPAVNAAELKIEGWLADCRSALSEWP